MKLLLVALAICFSSYAQYSQYATFLISDSLKVNANSVVRKNVLEVTVKNQTKLNIKKNRIITVLNEKGDDNIDLYEYYDNDSKILKLSTIVLDAEGNIVHKIFKKKFTDISAVSNGTLYSDTRVKYFNYVPTKYPYTIVFESETENNSTGFINSWYPIYNYSTSIEKSIYKFNNPTGILFRKKENNLTDYNIENRSTERNLHYIIKNEKAKKYESSGLPYFKIAPSVNVALDDFSLCNVKGSAKNWKEFGKWMYDELFFGRNKLEESTKVEIMNLVKEAKSDIEKAEIVYDYVQEKTRYVGVQIGIGGWSPIPASEVDKLGYGDCKGLTNYTKALLDVVGVKSYHTIVYAKKKRDLERDFASLQGNHMILNIPSDGNDLWLECTSQIHPFGFLGDFTDDRDVLVITPEGGVIKRTPAYINEDNSQETKADIIFNIDGSLTANVKRSSKGIQYDDKFSIKNKTQKDLEKYYKSKVWDYNNNIDIVSIDLKNNEEEILFEEDLSIKLSDYASIINNEFIFRVNVFNKFNHIPKKYRNRQTGFEESRGFLDKDFFTIKIPKGFNLGEFPEDYVLESKFGVYKVSLNKIGDDTFTFEKYFSLKKGSYTKKDYSVYRDFLKKISKYETRKIVLSKLKK